MAEEKKNMTGINDEELEDVAGGYESTYGNPNQSRFSVGQFVHFFDDNDNGTEGYIQTKRWGVYHYRCEDAHEWIYTIEDKYDHKIYERPERQIP